MGQRIIEGQLVVQGDIIMNGSSVVNADSLNQFREDAIETKFDKTGGQISGDVTIAGSLTVTANSIDAYSQFTLLTNDGYSTMIYRGENASGDIKIAAPNNSGTLATQEWVKANTICSSTIDQEFFNSLY